MKKLDEALAPNANGSQESGAQKRAWVAPELTTEAVRNTEAKYSYFLELGLGATAVGPPS